MEVTLSLVLLALLCGASLERVDGVLEHDDIRLVNVPDGDLCEGRLEIYHSTEFARAWLAVCDRSLGQEELRVICRQLGCPYSTSTQTSVARYGEQSGYMKALSRDCSGHEADYSQCVDTGSFVCDYQQTDLVGVVCSKGQWTRVWMTLTLTLSITAVLALL